MLKLRVYTLPIWFSLLFFPGAPLALGEDPSAKDPKEQEGPPSPGMQDEGLSWSVGAGFIASPRPYVGTKSRVFPIPAVTLDYKRFFFQGIRGGYHWLQSDRLTANVFAQMRFRGLEPEGSSYLEGMSERKTSMDAGVELVYQGRPVGFRASFITDVLGRSKGQEAGFLAVTGAPIGRVLVLFGIGPRWLSENRVDYYYGVREEEARPDRPAYQGEATWNLDLNLTAIWNVTPKWTLLAIVNREGFGKAIKNSPLVDRTSDYGLVSSLAYRF